MDGFLIFGNLMVLVIQETERDFHRNLRFHRKQKNPIIHIFLKSQSEIPFRKHCTVTAATASKLGRGEIYEDAMKLIYIQLEF